jgi:hypothetical protein
MGWLDKLRVTQDRQGALQAAEAGKVGATTRHAESAPAPQGGRPSNGLKDFLWHLDGIAHGTLLDLGPVWQATVGFFVERGFKVYTEDLLGAWKDFLRIEEERLRALPPGEDAPEISPASRAERFLEGSLQYPRDTFDAVLVWDLLDYLDSALVTQVVARLENLLRDGGVVLALFHSRKPDGFRRYRVLNAQNLEFLPAPAMFAVQRIYQNREILNLFGRFHSSKTYVGRDQLREGLFIK